MERIEIEKRFVEYQWMAIDGTKFDNEEECRKYEATVECAVTAQYNKRVVLHSDEYNVFGVGSSDEEVDIYKVECEEDKKIATELYKLLNNRDQDYVDRFYKSLEYGLNFLARGYGKDSIWFIGTPESMKDKIDMLVRECEPKTQA